MRADFVRGVGASALAAVLVAGCRAAPGESGEDATVRIDDFFGSTVVPALPRRVVAAESVTLGNVLALGVKPVAAAVNRKSLPHYLADQMAGVEDVTADNGINLEKALSLDPDLIVTIIGSAKDPWNKAEYDRYKAAVATFGYPNGYTYIEEIQRNLDEVARVLGRQDRARELLGRYRARTVELKERVRAAGLADKPVSVVRVSEGANYSIRIGTSESIAFRALGIAQPEGQRKPDDFSIKLSLERLEVLNQADTVFVYVDDNTTAEQTAILDSPLWKALDPVRAKRVHQVNSGVWNSIDIVGLMHILDDVERHFIVPAEG